MPKSQFIDPDRVRQKGEIIFQPIPVNRYNKSLKEERENFSDEDIEEMYEANRSDEHILKLKMVKELLAEYKK